MFLFTRRNRIAWFVLFASLGLTILVSWGQWEQNRLAAETQFKLQAQGVVEDIEARMRRQQQILLGGAGLVDASDHVSRDEWRTYVARLNLKENYPGIQGVGFSVVVQPAELKSHIAAIRAEGFPEFTVKPPGERPLYTSIIYLEPFAGRNLAAFGFDMFSEPTRRAAMTLAMESGKTVISGKVKLVQETQGKVQAGFLMYVPVYRKNLPLDTPEARGKAIHGFVYSPYRMGDLMQGVLGEINAVLDFTLHDGTVVNEGALLHASADDHAPDPAHVPRYTAQKRIAFYGTTWTASFHSRPAFEAQFSNRLTWVLLIFGGGISLALFALTSSLTGRREKALALAGRMTAQIRESEQRFRHILETSPTAARIALAGNRKVMFSNRRYAELLNLPPDRVEGVDPSTYYADRAVYEDVLARLKRGEPIRDRLVELNIPGAGAKWTLASYFQIEYEGQAAVLGWFHDITDRKNVEIELQRERDFGNALFSAAGAIMLVLDRDGRIVRFNAEAERISGYRLAEIEGKPFRDVFLPPEEAADVMRVFESIMAGSLVARHQNNWLTRDGSRRLVDWSNAVLFDSTGEVEFVVSVGVDITDSHRVRVEMEQFKATLDGTMDCVFMFDADALHFFYANQGAFQQVGYEQAELFAMHPYDIKPDFDEARFRAFIAPMLEGKLASTVFETVHQSKNGNLIPVEIFLQMFRPADRPAYFVAIVRDIKERKLAEVHLKEQAQRTQTILDNVVDGIITIDSMGKIASFNKAAEKIFGYAPAEVIDNNVRMLMPEPHRANHDGYLHNYMTTGVARIIGIGREVEGQRKDGSLFPMELAISEISHQGGRMFVGLVRDITERKRAEAEIRARENRIRALVDTIVDGIVVIDAKGLVQSMNPAAITLFGYAIEEVQGNNIKMLMPEPYAAEHDGYLHNYVTTGRKKIIGIGREVTGKRKDGTTFPMELAVSEMEVNGERMFTGIVRDITERKRIDRMKSEFVSTVSHELRTPLTSIRGSLGLITGGVLGELPEQVKAMLAIASNNTERLLMLINDILDMQKIEAGKMAFRFENTALMPLLEKAVDDLSMFGEQHKVRFEISQGIDDAQVFADRDRLMQVLANLMSNAAKFSPPDSTVQIALSRHMDGRLRISITDHGAGIPDAFKSQIFTPFSQSDSSDTRSKGGTGLGLAITRAIVERHGGTIGFVSRQGIGTTFYVELPEMRAADINSSEHPSALSAHDACVLIVEDDPDIAALIQRMLTEAGMNSDIAYTAGQARQLLAQNGDKYRLMTLDLLLPDEDGISLLESLRQEAATRNLPVVVVSVKADEVKQTLSGGALGVQDWLQKPIDATRLISVVKSAAACVDCRARVLHVEDEPDVRSIVATMLQGQCELVGVDTVTGARAALTSETFDLVLLDIGLPDGSGLDLIDLIEQRMTPPRIVIFSANDVAREYADRVSAVLVKSQTGNDDLLRVLLQSMRKD